METFRTFIAIDVKVDQVLLKKWYEIKSLLRNDSVNWVDEQSLHLTLFFLGNTPAYLIDKIAQQLDLELQKVSSFSIKLQGFGIFGKPKAPRVIWAGAVKMEPLFLLKNIVTSTVSSFGFDEPGGNFSPHFTLGRIKQIQSPDELINFIGRNKNEILQEVKVDRVIFYQSILKPTGPLYKPLKEFKLPSL